MAGKFPESFDDPLYSQLDASTERKLEIPVGLLSSIRTAGERSNASATNKFGTASPYQFIPATRKAILDKYGIDVLLSPENASEGAGLLLKESLKRNDGDAELAVREYHGGTDRENWGKVNDAYAGRVLAAQGNTKAQAMQSGFSKFMADNPAVPPNPGAAAAQPAPADDALSQGFGAWLSQKRAEPAAPAPKADPTLVDKIIGGGEAALTLATGATAGTVGMVGGMLGATAAGIANGDFDGSQKVVQAADQAAGEGAAAFTYAPRTEKGQEYAGNVGEAMATALPALPLTMEMGAMGKAAGAAAAGARDFAAPAVQAAKTAAQPVIERIRAAAPAIAERVERTLRRNPEPGAPTPGTLGSGGAAGTDMATQRVENAANLPLPIKLTSGQATRDPQQLRFELETAKGSSGGRLQERYSEQNELYGRNFDALVDQTGAEAADITGAGRAVDKALRDKAARDKAEIRVGYKNAEKAGEMEAPVALDQLVEHLNESAPDAATAPLLSVARARALQLGIAVEGEGGQLTAVPTTLKNAERMRQAIGRATDYEATNVRQSAIIKGLIDAETDGMGGNLYKAARRLRENYAKQYEDRAVVASLLNNKRGTADRKVALEDVFEHSVLKGSREDLGHVRRTLTAFPADAPPELVQAGQQAWKELQGATMQHIKDQAFANTATDMRGNVILSVPKLDKVIKAIDKDGKLDFMFGKQGAEQLRDLNDLAKVVYTAPPGVVNTSNTASVLLAAMTEAGVTGSMTGLPVPVLSALRLVAVQVKNHKLQKRIDRALNNQHTHAPHQPPPPADRTLH